MGFKLNYIVKYAIVIILFIALAYTLKHIYTTKENFGNAATEIVPSSYMTKGKQMNNTKDFFQQYGVAPYTNQYNANNLLNTDLNTFCAFLNRFGSTQNWRDNNGKMLSLNPNMQSFFNKIGFNEKNIQPQILNGNMYVLNPNDNSIHILTDDEMAKDIFSQLTVGNNSNSTSQNINNNNYNNNGAGQDNYNHYNGSSVPTMFYGPNGSTAKISTQNNSFSIIVTDNNGTSVVYDEENKSALAPSSLAAIDIVIEKVIAAFGKIQNQSSSNNSTSTNTTPVQKYYSQDGSVAIVYTDNNGNSVLKVIDPNGKEYAYTPANIQSFNPSIDNPNISQTDGNWVSPNVINQASNYNNAYSQSLTNENYSSSLPKGIPKYMIPPGNEDLYILKSEVVPPVCPACPPPILKCEDNKPPPPCPPCARCPEPQFDCKKVPNYGNGNIGANYYGGGGQFGSMPSVNGNFLPYPSLTDYTTFGN